MPPTPWPGLTDRRTLILPIPAHVRPPPATRPIIDGTAFEPKRELHITLAGREAVAALERVHGRTRLDAVLQTLFTACDWRYRRLHRYMLLRTRLPCGIVAGSIIERLDLPGLSAFYRALAAGGCALPVPPAHVTVWTHAKPEGIGVADAAALAELHVRDVAASELGLVPGPGASAAPEQAPAARAGRDSDA